MNSSQLLAMRRKEEAIETQKQQQQAAIAKKRYRALLIFLAVLFMFFGILGTCLALQDNAWKVISYISWVCALLVSCAGIISADMSEPRSDD